MGSCHTSLKTTQGNSISPSNGGGGDTAAANLLRQNEVLSSKPDSARAAPASGSAPFRPSSPAKGSPPSRESTLERTLSIGGLYEEGTSATTSSSSTTASADDELSTRVEPKNEVVEVLADSKQGTAFTTSSSKDPGSGRWCSMQ